MLYRNTRWYIESSWRWVIILLIIFL